MKLLKRTFTVLFSISVILSFASCSDSKKPSDEIISTTTTKQVESTTQSSSTITTTATTVSSESNATTSSTATQTTETVVSSETISTTEPVSSASSNNEIISIGGISFTKPSDFEQTESNGIITLTPSTTTEVADNIVVNVGADDITVYTVSKLEEILNNAFSAYGISVSNLTLKKDKLHACDCIQGHDYAEFTYDLVYSGEVYMSGKQVVLFVNNKSIHFTYTYVSNTYDSVFQNLIDSITID